MASFSVLNTLALLGFMGTCFLWTMFLANPASEAPFAVEPSSWWQVGGSTVDTVNANSGGTARGWGGAKNTASWGDAGGATSGPKKPDESAGGVGAKLEEEVKSSANGWGGAGGVNSGTKKSSDSWTGGGWVQSEPKELTGISGGSVEPGKGKKGEEESEAGAVKPEDGVKNSGSGWGGDGANQPASSVGNVKTGDRIKTSASGSGDAGGTSSNGGAIDPVSGWGNAQAGKSSSGVGDVKSKDGVKNSGSGWGGDGANQPASGVENAKTGDRVKNFGSDWVDAGGASSNGGAADPVSGWGNAQAGKSSSSAGDVKPEDAVASSASRWGSNGASQPASGVETVKPEDVVKNSANRWDDPGTRSTGNDAGVVVPEPKKPSGSWAGGHAQSKAEKNGDMGDVNSESRGKDPVSGWGNVGRSHPTTKAGNVNPKGELNSSVGGWGDAGGGKPEAKKSGGSWESVGGTGLQQGWQSIGEGVKPSGTKNTGNVKLEGTAKSNASGWSENGANKHASHFGEVKLEGESKESASGWGESPSVEPKPKKPRGSWGGAEDVGPSEEGKSSFGRANPEKKGDKFATSRIGTGDVMPEGERKESPTGWGGASDVKSEKEDAERVKPTPKKSSGTWDSVGEKKLEHGGNDDIGAVKSEGQGNKAEVVSGWVGTGSMKSKDEVQNRAWGAVGPSEAASSLSGTGNAKSEGTVKNSASGWNVGGDALAEERTKKFAWGTVDNKENARAPDKDENMAGSGRGAEGVIPTAGENVGSAESVQNGWTAEQSNSERNNPFGEDQAKSDLPATTGGKKAGVSHGGEDEVRSGWAAEPGEKKEESLLRGSNIPRGSGTALGWGDTSNAAVDEANTVQRAGARAGQTNEKVASSGRGDQVKNGWGKKEGAQGGQPPSGWAQKGAQGGQQGAESGQLQDGWGSNGTHGSQQGSGGGQPQSGWGENRARGDKQRAQDGESHNQRPGSCHSSTGVNSPFEATCAQLGEAACLQNSSFCKWT